MYNIDEENSDIDFQVTGDKVAMKVRNSSGQGGGSSDIYLIKESDATSPSDSNTFSALRTLKEINDNTHTHNNKTELDKIDQNLSTSADVVHNSFKTKGFVAGIGGKGASCDNNGNAELQSIKVNQFAEFAELRWNSVQVFLGTEVKSYGGGIIETVTPDKDSDGNELLTGTIKLHLNKGEIGKIAVDDICWGVFHDGMGNDNDAADYDNLKGVIKYAGYFTTFFRITSITDTAYNSVFTYALRQTSDTWSKSLHPRAMMHFAQRGNFSNTSRQDFRITTFKYEKIYEKISTWDLSDDNCTYFNGYKDFFSKTGIELGNGRSMYISNVVIDGVIQQFEKISSVMEINIEGDNFIGEGETKNVSCVIKNGYGQDITSSVKTWQVTRESGDEAEDNIWNLAHTSFSGAIALTLSDLGSHALTNISTLFTFTANGTITNTLEI